MNGDRAIVGSVIATAREMLSNGFTVMSRSRMYRFSFGGLFRGFSSSKRSLVISKAREPENLVSARKSSSECLQHAEVRMRFTRPGDYDGIMEFMCETYFKAEPSLVNIGLGGEGEPPARLLQFLYQQVKEGLTIIAEDADNCIVGAAVNAGSCPWDPEKMMEYAECFCEKGAVRDIVKFYAYVAKAPDLWSKYCVVKIFNCEALSVHPKYHGMGIGKQLVRESWFLARDCGYQVFRIDCTSEYAAKIAEGFCWECVFSMPYTRYIDSGGLVFKCIQEPHTTVRSFVDRPLICKDYCISNPDGCVVGRVPGGK